MTLCFFWGWDMIENRYATESVKRRARRAASCDHQRNRTGKAFEEIYDLKLMGYDVDRVVLSMVAVPGMRPVRIAIVGKSVAGGAMGVVSLRRARLYCGGCAMAKSGSSG